MELTIHCAGVYRGGAFQEGELSVHNGRVAAGSDGATVLELPKAYIFPGFADVHVHLREPGFSYKETIRTGTLAAAHGGFTAVCAMPNLEPVPDDRETLARELAILRRDAAVKALPYGAITAGERGGALSDMAAMAPDVCGFSDDGRGVQSEELMRQAMLRAKALGKLIAAHCEYDGLPAADPRSEWMQLRRDLRLAAETGCAYHVCHISCAESVAFIRQAKALGVDVTCETAPHYLLLSAFCAQDSGCYRMNPPLRGENDRQALLQGLRDGVIDMIATDHAPHAAEEKDRGFAGSLNGITGLEPAFAALYTGLVRTGEITLERLIELLSDRPRSRFGLGGGIEPGEPADFTVFDLSSPYTMDPARFLSLGKSTPFAGQTVWGRCLLTVCGGRVAWRAPELEGKV